MKTVSCGIDFGTSNSSVAVAGNGSVELVLIEEGSATIPSAIFFPADHTPAHFGRDAVRNFLSRREGRLMRSLKRVLGTSVMKHGTMVNGKVLRFERIISSFLNHLRTTTNTFVGQEIENVVMGRPVHFVDNDNSADSRAEDELRRIAMMTGFKNVHFQFEPIAAAFAHEINVSGEKLAVIADIGGGTSDFTVIRISSAYVNKADRTSDILANTGVRVGGNDFDKELSLAVVFPELGYASTYGAKRLEVPLKYYHDLAEWSKVNFLYTPKVTVHVRELLHESHDKPRFSRLLKILEQESGHAVLAAAEDTKLSLTTEPVYNAQFPFLEPGFSIPVSREKFEESIHNEITSIETSILECVRNAGVTTPDIQLVILTGGSTEVPIVQSSLRRIFPNATVSDQNKLSSVGLGLAYDSRRRFG
jgi:hypothetical chaperone protein